MAAKKTRTQLKSKKWLIIVGLLALAGVAFAGGGGLYAANLENHDSFCASCHTQPESTFYERTLASSAVDLASAHAGENVACIDCHSGTGVVGRMGAMVVGAGDLTAFLSGHYNNPAVETVPISDENCLKCHAKVTTTKKFENHFHYFLPQWQALDPNAAHCVSCHQGHNTGGIADIAFLDKMTTTNVCQSCHNAVGEGH